ncbi:hypothetical protein JXB41_01170 [Candidatus Woesearchaeota archaeon]|nr:hypothetical protein [Candidatus Woesearchaeota archaeon]
MTESTKFKPNLILHIEDDIEDDIGWIDRVYELLSENSKIIEGYQGSFTHIVSNIDSELSQSDLEKEIQRIEGNLDEKPIILSVMSGQVARTIIKKYLPGVIISDTGFPMNGKKTVEWLIYHGLEDYALIGLSGTPIKDLHDNIKEYFMKSNARYFSKTDIIEQMESIISQVLYNRRYHIQEFGS